MMPQKPATQRSPRELKLGKRAAPTPSAHRFVTGPGICARYQITDMSLYRWLADEQLGFPQPAMRVNGRRFWLETDLLAWELSRLRRDALANRHKEIV